MCDFFIFFRFFVRNFVQEGEWVTWHPAWAKHLCDQFIFLYIYTNEHQCRW